MFATSPMGTMLMPLIRQFTKGGAVDPASMQGTMNNMANMMGSGGMGNLFGNFGNGMFGGGNGNPFAAAANSFMNNTQSPSTTPKVTGHEGLTISTLPVKTKQATLYSSSTNVTKIFLKLQQLLKAQDPQFFDNSDNLRIFTDLKSALENRDTTPNYTIPVNTFNWISQLITLLPKDKVFPVFDILRLLVLHNTASAYYSAINNQTVDNLITDFILCDNPPSIAAQWLSSRVVSKILSYCNIH